MPGKHVDVVALEDGASVSSGQGRLGSMRHLEIQPWWTEAAGLADPDFDPA